MARSPGSQGVTAVVLEPGAPDARGVSFSLGAEQLEFLGRPRDVHVASILPGHVRGEHFHAERRELIVVIHEDDFSLHWDDGADGERHSRRFTGAGVVVVSIPPMAAHAVRNDGLRPLWLLAASDGPYDPQRPDAHARTVSEPPRPPADG